MEKRAISPIIATVLLIAIAVALFLTIFFWLKGFQKESIIKRGTSIENVCPNVKFEVRKVGATLQILNMGDVTIQKFKISGSGETSGPILPGEIINKTVSCTGATLKIVPILRGRTSKGYQDYPCEAQAKEISC